MRALALGCFYSHISTGTFRGALTASLDSCAEIKSTFSGVTKSGKIWRKVPEIDARSVSLKVSVQPLDASTSLISRMVSVDVRHKVSFLFENMYLWCNK